MNARIRTAYGLLEGEQTADGKVAAFKGVPYAMPPLGALRWQPPQRLESWSGVRPAKTFSAACVQPSMPDNSLVYGGEKVMSEDCLYLNVWSGNTEPGSKLPVIVWIHLGGFMMGWGQSPIYDGAALARAGAVVVTINYRLGRFGFLAHPALSAESSYGCSGNYGLMDQIAALQWVQENIAAFGGDTDCVTLYGVSAGGFSTSALMASPLAKGLFHRAIGASGGAFGPIADSCEAGDCLQTLQAAEQLCAQLMASIGAHTAEQLRALSAEAILAAKIPVFWQAPRGLLDTTYPILDGRVLPLDPLTAFCTGQYNDVPLITGSNAHESSIVPFNQDTDSYLADSKSFFGPFFERFIAMFPAGADGLTLHSSMVANSDRLFSWQNWQWARLQAAHGRHPVYYYNFVHEPPVPTNSVAEQGLNANVGAFHSAELPYVFRNLQARAWPWSSADRALSETMSGYWLQFARTGNPNGDGRPHWSAFDNSAQAMMRFAETPMPTTAIPSARFAFWDEFYAWFRQQKSV